MVRLLTMAICGAGCTTSQEPLDEARLASANPYEGFFAHPSVGMIDIGPADEDG